MLLLRSLLIMCSLSFSLLGLFAEENEDEELGSMFRKEYKRTVKKLKKEGWTVNGVSQSLETVLKSHYLTIKKTGADAIVIEGHGMANSINVAIKKAISNASVQYASMCESDITGDVNLNITNEQGNEASTKTRMDASYTSTFTQTLKAFKPTVMLYRENSDGKFEAKVLYVINK